MPFWQQIQRCEHCAHWKQADPSDDKGVCWGEHAAKRMPFWSYARETRTKWDDGMTCQAYKHDANKTHPLDDAHAFIALAEVGDKLPMRTYSRGEPSRAALAEIVHRNSQCFTVRMFNGLYRMRLNATTTHKAGTLIELDDWGVDTQGEIERIAARVEHPEKAVDILKQAKVGSTIGLVGYPPFNNMRKTAKVLGISDRYVTLRIDRHRRKSRMYVSGPLAGIIEGEVWTLDTTDGHLELAIAIDKIKTTGETP